jgi:hypothetical protein
MKSRTSSVLFGNSERPLTEKRLGMLTENSSRRWTQEEDDLFRKMAEANVRPELIAEKLNRSIHVIKARAYAIGLPLKWFKLKPVVQQKRLS